VSTTLEEPEYTTDSRLANSDLAQIPKKRRTWTWYAYMALWMGMIHNIFNYAVAASLMAKGMSAWQAILTILAGNFVLIIPLLLIGHIGSRYGITFPVLARLSYGVFGANVPALIRAFVAIGWFGIQSYLGGAAFNVLLLKLIPGWQTLNEAFLGLQLNEFIALVAFWVLEAFVTVHGIDVVRRFENFAGPIILVLMLGLLYWALTRMNGLGPLFDEPSKIHSTGGFLLVFVPGVITIVGTFASMALNITDFTRFSRSSKDQAVGQILGLPIATLVFSFMVAITTSATIVVFGGKIWDPTKLLAHFNNVGILVVAVLALAAATISVNVAANLVSPIYDLINAFPRWLTYKRSVLVCVVLSFVIMPWKLMQSPDAVEGLLDAAGAFLGPATGVIIADFWLVKKRRISSRDLYRVEGAYYYRNGFNIVALVATGVGMLLSFSGNFLPALSFVKGYGWLIGIIAGFVIYSVLMGAFQNGRRNMIANRAGIENDPEV
jgi:NCS1 family nucleobase:cation symporter-1